MIARTENGWGSVFNGGITGGAGGVELSFSDFPDMWIWMLSNPTTPAILTYTGPNFSRIGFPREAPNSTFSNGTRFEIIGLQNKTIKASQGQRLDWCEIRFRSATNIIWENWNQKDSLEDLVDIISDSTNIWIRHCTLNMNVFNQSPASGVDGNLDVGLRSNHIAVTDCLFENGDKTFLVSFSNDEPLDVGKMKVTVRRCKFLNCVQRKIFARYGDIGYEYNVIDDRDLTIFSKCVSVGKLSRFFVYRCNFIGGASQIFEDRLTMDSLPIEDAGALKSVENVIASGQSLTDEIRPELVTWSPLTEPNYTLETWTAAEALAYVDQWAGATMHLMNEETTYNIILQSSNETFGTVLRSLSNPVTAGATDILTATPIGTGVFQGWYLGSVSFANLITTNNPYSRVVNSDATIIASFIDGTPIPPEQPRKKFAKKRNEVV